jgi:hypothetical protein
MAAVQLRRPVGGGGEVTDHALVDLLDRLLAGGVVIEGDITLAVADVDLVHLSLRAVLAAVETLECPTSTR